MTVKNESGEVGANSYDVVPYRASPYPYAHLRHLEAIATLFGIGPPDITAARVLEIGGAAGGNLIPQAQGLPQSTFLGIDLSERQIRDGQGIVDSLGLKNITLRHADLMDIDGSWGEFDYIIAHGVFSWVPAEVQDKLLEISARNLAPNGVAFISFNTYPGWHLAGIVREVMRYHAAQFSDVDDQIAQSKAMLQFLVELSSEKEPMGMLLRKELDLLKLVDNDSYLFHEHLESTNLPLYFHEFMDRAESKGLQYVGDAEFSTMLLRNLPEKAQRAFHQLSAVRQEQYMDFIRGRRFRKTLLCRQGVKINRRVAPETLKQFHFGLARGVKTDGEVNIHNDSKATFIMDTNKFSTDDRMTKAAMMYLREIQPAYVSFRDLHLATMARVSQGQPSGRHADVALSADALAHGLLFAYSIDLLHIAIHPPQCVATISSHPTASPLARFQATQGNTVTSQWHENVGLDPLGNRLIRRLDGAHRRDELLGVAEEAIEAGEVVVKTPHGRAKRVSRSTVTTILDQALGNISRSALLID